MRAIKTEEKAPGGWQASQGRIPVTGTSLTYPVFNWWQCLFLTLGKAVGYSLGNSSLIETQAEVLK
jgi:hypothetical protein